MAKIDENLIIHFFPRYVHKTFPCSKEFDNHGRSQSNTKFVPCKSIFWCPERTSLCTRVVPTISERKRDDMEEIGDKLPPRPSDLQFVRGGIAPLKHALR